jgi:site-specific recombinase XerD
MSPVDLWPVIRRHASDAGIETAIGCHAFRATGKTDYLTYGGCTEFAQRMAGHPKAKTTGSMTRATTTAASTT